MSDNSKWALALGYAGVLPVAGLLVSAWSGAWQHQAVNSAIIYAALILSFLGGIHWGFATSGFASKKHFLVSVVPSLWAWMVFAAPDFFTLLGIIFGLITFLVYEQRCDLIEKYPEWYLPLRKHLTFGLSISLAGLLPIALQ